MDIKKLGNSVLIFTINRIIEIIGLLFICLGLFLLVALLSYSPEDPNFIFPENAKINNILGFQGSYTSDLFIQSLGLISFLIPITFIFTGINIFKSKEYFLLIENTFFIILYASIGSLFLSFYYKDNFIFYINGNGGFVGNYFGHLLTNDFILSYKIFFYYSLLILTIILFLKSINFKIKKLNELFKKIFSKDNSKNYTNKNEVIDEYIPQEEIKNLIQEDLPFIKTETAQSSIKKKVFASINRFIETTFKKRTSKYR